VSSFYTNNQITIEWTIPDDNGGCSILGYKILRTAGSSNNFDPTDPSIEVTGFDERNPSLS